MPDSTYKIIELVGTSALSWEDAAKKCRGDSRQHPSRLRVAEVTKLDMTIEDGKVKSYRARVRVSFRLGD